MNKSAFIDFKVNFFVFCIIECDCSFIWSFQLMDQVLCLIIVNRRSCMLLSHLCLRKWLPRLTLLQKRLIPFLSAPDLFFMWRFLTSELFFSKSYYMVENVGKRKVAGLLLTPLPHAPQLGTTVYCVVFNNFRVKV